MTDPTLYLYTSLTAGSSHIITATSRLETILKANKIPFRAIDVATDEAARKLWARRSKGKKLPGLVKYGTVVGDLEQIEEWNEFGELKMQINGVEPFDDLPATDTPLPPTQPTSTSASTPKTEAPAPKASTIKIQDPRDKETQMDDSVTKALRQAGAEAAAKAKEPTKEPTAPAPAAAEPQIPAPTSDAGPKEGSGQQSVRRTSVAPEIAESGSKRPPLVPECAAESSANFHADNAEALGLINHHRNSNIAAESKEEAEKMAKELRKSISGAHNPALESLREQKATLAAEATVEDALEG
ncbi:uncharacterized protein DSM5745_07201 [Aspergillus mulundensis]|uniref:Uncharacterized protein n=1 Tax=Aspergillus mulundensis TaxID=1810919 RepID=A0A3D8RKG0_9EURO|nr:Uncharacterized protein DSM5745_07201 [Aspergillus mulundensis]RDW74539.1 Uncharacterized protein DSM5745_07201 [Aspergillus mulundensis]